MKQIVVLHEKVYLQGKQEYALSFNDFRKKVRAIVAKSGEVVAVNFYYDKEKGRYYANCSNDVTIIGNPSSLKIKVRWGSKHEAAAYL